MFQLVKSSSFRALLTRRCFSVESYVEYSLIIQENGQLQGIPMSRKVEMFQLENREKPTARSRDIISGLFRFWIVLEEKRLEAGNVGIGIG